MEIRSVLKNLIAVCVDMNLEVERKAYQQELEFYEKRLNR